LHGWEEDIEKRGSFNDDNQKKEWFGTLPLVLGFPLRGNVREVWVGAFKKGDVNVVYVGPGGKRRDTNIEPEISVSP